MKSDTVGDWPPPPPNPKIPTKNHEAAIRGALQHIAFRQSQIANTMIWTNRWLAAIAVILIAVAIR